MSTIIEVNGLPGVCLTLEVFDMSDEDVAEARRQAAACNVDHPLVQRMLWSLVDGFGLVSSGPDWAPGELLTLLQALGLLPEWTTAVDVELAHMLRTAAGGEGCHVG
ncbi:hypothetical protein AB0F77_20920 [Streptomyces sp. NPDC026672]|uniref:hypothetical protein n=1 Tax=unclassified Streptomyces TaxID=2593676 RepID=UPI0033F66013